MNNFEHLTNKMTEYKVKPLEGDLEEKKDIAKKEGKTLVTTQKKIDYEFATETSMHGVGFLATATTFPAKTAWLIIVLFLSSMLIWQATEQLIGFFKYAPVTDVSVKVRRKMRVETCRYKLP